MHSVSTELRTLIEESNELWALPRLRAEWNQNRYAGIAEIDNDPSEESVGYDRDFYPIESIAEPNRPTRGVVYARDGQTGLMESFNTSPQDTRFYVIDETCIYKYWTSPAASQVEIGTGWEFPSGYEVKPYILYENPAWVNKIVVKFETFASTPEEFHIDITVNGTDWVTISDKPPIDANGQVTIYLQELGGWTEEEYLGAAVEIMGIRLVVDSLDVVGKYLNLIELSSRLEIDLTAFVISDSSNFEMSEMSLITPLGKASSNTASVKLSNIWSANGGFFDNENPDTILQGIVDHNVKLTMDVVYTYQVEEEVEPDVFEMVDVQEAVRRFTMYAGEWNGQGTEEISLELKDYSKFFQEVTPPKTLFENNTLGEIVWKVCDSIGFVDYEYDSKAVDVATLVPWFWMDGEKNAWEILADLAEATQSAIFFDEYGVLHIQTRNAAYDLDKLAGPADWALSTVKVGNKQADIAHDGITQTDEFNANQATIRYKTLKTSDDQNGLPQMETVWEAEDTVTLRSSKLTRELTSGETFHFWINQDDSKVWPYEGVVQINGEFIRYNGRGYHWYNPNGTKSSKFIFSHEEKQAIDAASSPTLRHQNFFSGSFKIVERGLWNSDVITHKITPQSYAKQRFNVSLAAAPSEWNTGFVHLKNDGLLRLQTASWFSGRAHYYVARRGSHLDQGYRHLGTRLRLVGGYGDYGDAGIVFNISNVSNRTLAGYYVVLCTTAIAEKFGRKYGHELTLYSLRSDGTYSRLASTPMQVAYNVWYDLDVQFLESGSTHQIRVMVNGSPKLSADTSSSTWKHVKNARHGLFVRGYSAADFEYLYAMDGTHPELEREDLDGAGFFDRIRGGYVSGAVNNWVYKLKTATRIRNRRIETYLQRYYQRFFDEFGSVVHEVREFDVDFAKFPAVHSKIFSTNEGVLVPEYNSDPFGANFVLANGSRINQVASGQDSVTFGADNPVDQKLLIYGRTVFEDDQQEHVVRNESAIRRSGIIDVTIESMWIQSKAMAEGIGQWIVDHWGPGCDQVDVEIFGNPLIQVGDYVTINYPVKSMTPATHQYIVIGVRNSFDRGLTTSLTLRRVRV